MSKRWCYSTDGELFTGGYESRKEAIKDGLEEVLLYGEEDLFIGVESPVDVSTFVLCDQVIEELQENAMELCGEVAEDYLGGVSPRDKDILDEMLTETVEKWMTATNNRPTFHHVVDEEKLPIIRYTNSDGTGSVKLTDKDGEQLTIGITKNATTGRLSLTDKGEDVDKVFKACDSEWVVATTEEQAKQFYKETTSWSSEEVDEAWEGEVPLSNKMYVLLSEVPNAMQIVKTNDLVKRDGQLFVLMPFSWVLDNSKTKSPYVIATGE